MLGSGGNARHGGPVEEPPQDVFLSSDPHIGLVHANMHTWLQAHPCTCHQDHLVCRCLDDEDYEDTIP